MIFKYNRYLVMTASACLVILLSAKEGYVTKTYYRDVSLEHLAASADYILHVEKEKPFSTQKEIRIEKDGTLYHVFTLAEFHFKLVKIIRSRGRFTVPCAGTSIIVHPAYSRDMLNLNRLFYLEGISKSPVLERYTGTAGFESSSELIIFVNREDDGTFEFTCEYGYESVEREKEIEGIAGIKI